MTAEEVEKFFLEYLEFLLQRGLKPTIELRELWDNWILRHYRIGLIDQATHSKLWRTKPEPPAHMLFKDDQ
jgi:hypothetical protein